MTNPWQQPNQGPMPPGSNGPEHYPTPGYGPGQYSPSGVPQGQTPPPGFPPGHYPQPGFAPPGFAPPGFASPGFAPPGFAPPGFPPGYPPPPWMQPRKRRSRWLTVGLPVGIVGVVVAVITVLIVLGVSVSHDVNAAQYAAAKYGAAVSSGRYTDAQAMLCTADKSQVTSDELAAHYSNPRVVGYQVIAVNVENINGQTAARAVLVLRTDDGLSNQISLDMAKESDGWHPCP